MAEEQWPEEQYAEEPWAEDDWLEGSNDEVANNEDWVEESSDSATNAVAAIEDPVVVEDLNDPATNVVAVDDPAVVELKDALEAIRNELAQAGEGSEFTLDLSGKMGMVVNSDATVSKIVEGGQADNSGVRLGCKIVWAGDGEILSLDDLKRAISSSKAQGQVALSVLFKDPRRLVKARAEEARLKAAVSKAAAEAAGREAEAAQLRAEQEAATARAVAEANEKVRHDAEEEVRRLFEENELARQRAKEEADAVLVANEMAREAAELKAKLLAEQNERARAAAEEAARQVEIKRRRVMEEAKAAALERIRLQEEQEAEVELQKKLKERRAGSASIQVSIMAAKGVLARDANGFSDVYAVVEVIDLLTNRGVEMSDNNPTELKAHKTKIVKRTLDPFWLERASWSDVPLPPTALGLRVKLFDYDRWSPEPLGQVLLPLVPPNTPQEEEEHCGHLLDRDLWYRLGPSPKMKLEPTGEVQLRVVWNEFRLFDCAVCGKFNSKEAKNFCRCCGAKVHRKPNNKVSQDDGSAQRLHKVWAMRRRENFQIKREPLPIPPPAMLEPDESEL
jgi:hypothetical protein